MFLWGLTEIEHTESVNNKTLNPKRSLQIWKTRFLKTFRRSIHHVALQLRCFWLHVNRWGRKKDAVPSSGTSSKNSAGLVSMATTTSVSASIVTQRGSDTLPLLQTKNKRRERQLFFNWNQSKKFYLVIQLFITVESTQQDAAVCSRSRSVTELGKQLLPPESLERFNKSDRYQTWVRKLKRIHAIRTESSQHVFFKLRKHTVCLSCKWWLA